MTSIYFSDANNGFIVGGSVNITDLKDEKGLAKGIRVELIIPL